MNKLKKIIFQSGYDENVYKEYRNEIINQNGRNVLITSFIGSIIMIVLTIFSLFSSSISRVLPLYFTTAIEFILIYIIARYNEKKEGKMSIIYNYAFLTAAFGFALGLDIIQKNPNATTICVLLVALPLLIVDKPYREFYYLAIISVLFILESYFVKQSPKAFIDALNSISFFVVGTFLGYKHNQMVIRNFINQRLLQIQSDTDTLTTLYNKGAIEYKAIEFLSINDVEASIMVIDMDDFKYVNDTYGHHTGDEILIKIANLLSSLCRKNDMISRFGGDEFIIFLPMLSDKVVLEKKAKQILQGIEKIRIEANNEYRAHMSIGIAIYPKDGRSYEELFKSADAAMYRAKRNGKNNYCFYDSNVKKKILVVDDIEMSRVVIQKILCNDFDVLSACNGKEALELIEDNHDIELIITDIVMPVMDGIELVKQIRNHKEFNHIAILANSQYDNPEQEQLLYELGVDDFVYKASSPSVIKVRVNNILKLKEEVK